LPCNGSLIFLFNTPKFKIAESITDIGDDFCARREDPLRDVPLRDPDLRDGLLLEPDLCDVLLRDLDLRDVLLRDLDAPPLFVFLDRERVRLDFRVVII
jgi:hypothetical protein